MKERFKSIAITGHTKGIGKGLYDYFVNAGFMVKGFSRENGFDISWYKNIDQIIEETVDCDLFINNAYYEDQQANIALQWHMAHYNKNHYILNVSSLGSDQNVAQILSITNKEIIEYGLNKQLLNNIGNSINFSDSSARCITVIPGIVNTDFTKDFPLDEGMLNFFHRTLTKNTVLTVNDVVESVVTILDSITDKHFISSYTLLNG